MTLLVRPIVWYKTTDLIQIPQQLWFTPISPHKKSTGTQLQVSGSQWKYGTEHSLKKYSQKCGGQSSIPFRGFFLSRSGSSPVEAFSKMPSKPIQTLSGSLERHSWGGQKLNSKLKTFPSDVCVPDFAPGFLALLLLLAAPRFLKSFGSFIFILVAALDSTAFECYKYKAFPRTHATDLLLFTAIMHHYSILMSSWSLIISTSSL